MKFTQHYLRVICATISLILSTFTFGVGKLKIKNLFRHGIISAIPSLNSKSIIKPHIPIIQQNALTSYSFVKTVLENFHTVEEGKLYRSGQLNSERLSYYVQKYNIKTIINLRGPNPQEDWWQQEKLTAQNFSIQHYDIPMHSVYLPSKSNLQKLLKLYDNAPKPILVHCLSGADRTGEAAALWKLEQERKSKKEAKKQLSLLYGYFKRRKPAKRFLISIWEGRQWLAEHYDPARYPHYCPE